MECLGHFDAVHENTTETVDCITLGDFNFHYDDANNRKRLIEESLTSKSYNLQSDLRFLTSDYSHKAGWLIDRILHTTSLNNALNSFKVIQKYYDSDHFPVHATLNIQHEIIEEEITNKPYLAWKKASQKALKSFSNLCEEKCRISLNKYQRKEIHGNELYGEIVENITYAANTCIPKIDPSKKPKRHNIPQWREKNRSISKRC